MHTVLPPIHRCQRTLVILAALALLPALAQAQGPQRQERFKDRGMGGPSASGAMTRYFFQPRFVLANAEHIGLTSEQRTEVEAAGAESQAAYRTQRFELSNALTAMAGLAVQHPVSEAAVLEQLDTILELEREIKQTQIRLLVRVKNVLTPEQQAQLDEIRRSSQPRGGFRPQ